MQTSTTIAGRITTREAATILKRGASETLALLKAANIPHDRAGATYLWHAGAVERFAAALHAAASERAAAPAAVQAQG